MKKFLSAPTNFLNRNTGFLILLAIVFFGIAILHQQRDNRQLLLNSNTTINQLNEVLCRNIPAKECNLTKAVTELKSQNSCLFNLFVSFIDGGGKPTHADIKNCQVASSGASNDVAQSPSASASTASLSPSQSNASGASVSALGGSSSPNPTPPSNPPPSDNPQPFNIFGIPLCVPLVTNVCVEH